MNDGWRKIRIGDWGDVGGGRQRSPHLTAGRIRPYLRVANVFEDHIDTADVLQMAFTDAEFARYRLEPGDVLLNEGQSLELVGRSAVYEGMPPDCAFQNTLVRFRAGSECDYRFAQQVFKQLWRSGVFQGIAKRTTSIAHLGVNRFADLVITVPPLAAQRRIADDLSQFDATTKSLGQLIDAKRTFKRGLMQQLLTGQKRFPEFVKSTDRQPGEFGTIPVDWRLVHIAEIAKEVKTRGAIEGAVVYSCTKHEGLVPSLEYFGKQIFSRNLDGYLRLRAGDFAYATNHIEEGSIGLLRAGQPPGLVSPMYTVFRGAADVNPDYLYALLKTENYRRVFEKRTSSSVDRRGSLRWKEFSRIRIPLLSRPEQDRIATILQLADAELDLLTAQREQVERLKRSLLSRLLSGSLQVPV